jgi:hypothetical protein
VSTASAPRGAEQIGPRPLAPWLIAVPVVAAHLLLAAWWPDAHLGLGEGTQIPPRIEVAFVRDLQPARPAAAPVRPLPVPTTTRILRAPRPLVAASAPGGMLPEEPLAVSEAPVDPLPLPLALAELAPPPALAAAAPSSAAAPAFEWPPSTRLSYLLTGNYRGPVEGQARVEWRLAGNRYQVALEVGIGPPFAPIATRQLLSDGFITPEGLEPRRYDEETTVALRAPRRLTISMEGEQVRLPSGRQLPRPTGVQDSASQFVQMTWLFTLQPSRLQAGQTVQLPLALPRHVEVWTYEVVGEALLETPVGLLDTVHVRPRRPARAVQAPGGELVAEFWVAPMLQYLPVRFLIHQDEETYVDLRLQRLPQQAAAATTR